MCSSTSLAIRGLVDKVVWRSIACIFCRLHTDPSLTPPWGWLPRPSFHPHTIACHACLAQFIDMQQNPGFKNARKKRKKDWKKEIFPCVMTASLQQCHLAAWCWISFSVIGDVYLYHFVHKVKYHKYFWWITATSLHIKGKWYTYSFNNLILSEDVNTWENCITWRKL